MKEEQIYVLIKKNPLKCRVRACPLAVVNLINSSNVYESGGVCAKFKISWTVMWIHYGK